MSIEPSLRPRRAAASRRHWLMAAGGAGLSLLATSGCSRVGDAAPDFSVRTQYGRSVGPSSYRGKLLLIMMWATW